MGGVFTTVYKHTKRVVSLYNIENRTQKFLEKGDLPKAPKYPSKIDIKELFKENPALKKELEELNVKDKNLDEYLKKIYLTTKSGESSLTVPKSKRSLPVRTDIVPNSLMNVDCPPGHLSLVQLIEMMMKNYEDPETWNSVKLAETYKLDRKTVVYLLTYYSLFRQEKFEFMNATGPKEPAKPQMEVYTTLEKKPLKKIAAK